MRLVFDQSSPVHPACTLSVTEERGQRRRIDMSKIYLLCVFMFDITITSKIPPSLRKAVTPQGGGKFLGTLKRNVFTNIG